MKTVSLIECKKKIIEVLKKKFEMPVKTISISSLLSKVMWKA
jgi:hypothetical protein